MELTETEVLPFHAYTRTTEPKRTTVVPFQTREASPVTHAPLHTPG